MGLKNFARENKEGEGYEQTNVKVLETCEIRYRVSQVKIVKQWGTRNFSQAWTISDSQLPANVRRRQKIKVMVKVKAGIWHSEEKLPPLSGTLPKLLSL